MRTRHTYSTSTLSINIRQNREDPVETEFPVIIFTSNILLQRQKCFQKLAKLRGSITYSCSQIIHCSLSNRSFVRRRKNRKCRHLAVSGDFFRIRLTPDIAKSHFLGMKTPYCKNINDVRSY